MKTEITIEVRESVYTLEKSASLTVIKMPKFIKNSYIEIVGYLKSVNYENIEPPFVRYSNIDWEKEAKKKNFFTNIILMFTKNWDITAGFFLKEKLAGSVEIKSGVLKGGRYLSTLHKGAYYKVGETYTKLINYAKSNNISFENESIEIYKNDPRETPKDRLETIVLIPIKE